MNAVVTHGPFFTYVVTLSEISQQNDKWTQCPPVYFEGRMYKTMVRKIVEFDEGDEYEQLEMYVFFLDKRVRASFFKIEPNKQIEFAYNDSLSIHRYCLNNRDGNTMDILVRIDLSALHTVVAEEVKTKTFVPNNGILASKKGATDKDVILLAGEDKIPVSVHKFVLTLFSPVFNEMLMTSCMEEARSGRVCLSDFDAGLVTTMVDFLYDGFISDKTRADHLYILASKYQIEALRAEAELLLVEDVITASSGRILAPFMPLEFAEMYGAPKLAAKFLNQFKNCASDIMTIHSQEYLALSVEIKNKLMFALTNC